MKYNYSIIMVAFLFLFATTVNAQNIKFTFANAQHTNDGVDDYLEADIMIETIDGLADFTLGSGQVYLQYNAASFGSNTAASGDFTYTYPDDQGYLMAEYYVNFGTNAYGYGPHIYTDTASQIISIAFLQNVSSFVWDVSGMDGVVTATARKLCHIKIKYVDFNQIKEFSFVDRELATDPGTGAIIAACRDQFFTAAGSSTTATIDWPNEPGTQFNDAIFDSSGLDVVLPVEDVNTLDNFVSVYPNPIKTTDTKINFNLPNNVEQLDLTLYDITGKTVQQYKNVSVQAGANSINKPNLAKGIYFLKFFINNGEQQATKKMVID